MPLTKDAKGYVFVPEFPMMMEKGFMNAKVGIAERLLTKKNCRAKCTFSSNHDGSRNRAHNKGSTVTVGLGA